MKEQELLRKLAPSLDEIIMMELSKADGALTDYYSTWYSKNDVLGAKEQWDAMGHLMPRVKKVVDKNTDEITSVELFWNYAGKKTKKQHKHSAMKYIKKGKGTRYTNANLKKYSDLEWEINLAIETEDRFEFIRKRLKSVFRIKKAIKDSANLYSTI